MLNRILSWMRKVKLIDSMRDFLTYWRTYSGRDPKEMFQGWLMDYISNYPELLIAEVNYRRGLTQLRNIMIKEVLPKLDLMIHDIIEAWMLILQNLEAVYSLAAEVLPSHLDPIFAIYVASGWRRDWIASILGKPAVFIDLGGLAEVNWVSEDKIRGMLAFNLGTLYHALRRGGVEKFRKLEADPFFRLYSEGFAQLTEHLILNLEFSHVLTEGSVKKFEQKIPEIAVEYLTRAEKGDVEDFYSPKNEIHGVKFAAAYLGHLFSKTLGEEEIDLEELAGLPEPDVERFSKNLLRELAEKTRK